MKIVLYVILALVLIGGLLFSFAAYKFHIPKLVIPEGSSEAKKIELLDDWLLSLQENGKFNGGILLAKEGQPIFMKTYGYTNYTEDESLTPQSAFRLASVSKQFTAAGVMLLHEMGKVDYDEGVSTYLESFPYPGVTVRHLLNQTSGVPDVYMGLAEEQRQEIGDTLSLTEAVRLGLCKPKGRCS